MKKNPWILTLILWFGMVSPSAAVHFGLKFSGGISLYQPENINHMLQDWLDFHIRDGDVHANFEFLEGQITTIRSTFDMEGEIFLSLNERVGFGLGTGLFFAEVPQEKTESSIKKIIGTFIQVHPVQISGFPVTLSAYYFIPLFGKFLVYGKAGAGFIWMKYVDRDGRRLTENTNFSFQQFNDARGKTPVYLGGVGLMFQVEPGIRVFVEGTYRQAEISGLTGKNQGGEGGTLYHFEEYDPTLDFWKSQFQVLPEAPSGDNFRSVGEAVFNLSGITIKAGLIIRF